jgi:hypothetical protein
MTTTGGNGADKLGTLKLRRHMTDRDRALAQNKHEA